MLTNKGKYGLKAVVHLAGLAPGTLIGVAEIATQQRIPKKFLDTILMELRLAGFLVSKKGPGGGYKLGLPADQIRVGDIVRVLDGALAPFPCASRSAHRPCLDCDERTCPVRLAMLEVRDRIASVLDNMSVAQLRSVSDAETFGIGYQI